MFLKKQSERVVEMSPINYAPFFETIENVVLKFGSCTIFSCGAMSHLDTVIALPEYVSNEVFKDNVHLDDFIEQFKCFTDNLLDGDGIIDDWAGGIVEFYFK